ncbi:MerR family transcriptional regulator [Mycetocola zhadangensis]|uniref:MerR family transcriptional regulator n=1 Tax=Mycetocola zhadangensis TaxID=1164595 RepID=A0A3L7ISQ3_9MICO|nr:MerR family transcriptional regulator [Mycetocola zhadangensis]RLQ81254.1 MerR family transcriptional regulator [Mycetocola zhadangensis]
MRIGELSTRSGVSVRSLRYYEQQGLLTPQRTAGGQRAYTTEHLGIVIEIQELFRAGFCSAVIRELLPALDAPAKAGDQLEAAFDAAAARLHSEKAAIEAELSVLLRFRCRLGLAPDTRVSMQGGDHEPSATTPPAPFDHRDRRLR